MLLRTFYQGGVYEGSEPTPPPPREQTAQQGPGPGPGPRRPPPGAPKPDAPNDDARSDARNGRRDGSKNPYDSAKRRDSEHVGQVSAGQGGPQLIPILRYDEV